MSLVDPLVEEVLAREGGFVDHPADRGGPTKFGITRATLSRHLGRSASLAEIRGLTKEQAAAIYHRDYYLQPGINRLPARLRSFLFDAAVNHGPKRAIRFLQAVCQQAGFGPLAEDGVCGPATEAVARRAEAAMGAWLLAALIEERRQFYHQIVRSDGTQKAFLNGWLNRLAAFDRQVERLVA